MLLTQSVVVNGLEFPSPKHGPHIYKINAKGRYEKICFNDLQKKKERVQPDIFQVTTSFTILSKTSHLQNQFNSMIRKSNQPHAHYIIKTCLTDNKFKWHQFHIQINITLGGKKSTH